MEVLNLSGNADRAEGDEVWTRAVLPGVHTETPQRGSFGKMPAVL